MTFYDVDMKGHSKTFMSQSMVIAMVMMMVMTFYDDMKEHSMTFMMHSMVMANMMLVAMVMMIVMTFEDILS